MNGNKERPMSTVDRLVQIAAARTVTGSIYEMPAKRKPKKAKRVATNRPGDMAAEYAEEFGVSYSQALIACNMD